MAGGNRYKHRSLGGRLVPNGQQEPQNNFYVAPPPEPSMLEKALQLAQALGDSSSEYTAKANADPGNLISPFGALPTQFMKDTGQHLWDNKLGLVPARKAWDAATTLADILSGKEQSTPFAPAQGNQLAGDAANNAAIAALDASTLVPGFGMIPKGTYKTAGKSALKFMQVEPPAGYVAAPRAAGPSVKAANDDTLLSAIRQAMTPAKENYGRTPGVIAKNTDGSLNTYNKPIANDADGYSFALSKQTADRNAPYLFEGRPLADAAGKRGFEVDTVPGSGLGAEPPELVADSWGKIWLQRFGDPQLAMQHAMEKGRPDVAQKIQGWLNNGQLKQATQSDLRSMAIQDAIKRQKNPQKGPPADVLPFARPTPPGSPTTLGMGLPFSGKDGEKPLLSALMDAFKGKQAPAASPLDQFTPPTSIDDIFTGGSPRAPREITGGSQAPAGLEGSFMHDPRFNGPKDAVPYTEGQGFGGLDARLGGPSRLTVSDVPETPFLRDFQYSLPGGAGNMKAKIIDDHMDIVHSEIPDALRGQGNGLAMYQAALDWAKKNGVNRVNSDIALTPGGEGIYKALGRNGYDVQRNPDAFFGNGMLRHPVDPVYRVDLGGGGKPKTESDLIAFLLAYGGLGGMSAGALATMDAQKHQQGGM